MRAFVAALLLPALAAIAGPEAAAQQRKPGARPPSSVDRPDNIFQNHCSVCHGEKGDGQSFARFTLDPPPVDFTSPKTREKLARAHMIETVKRGARTKEGKPTAMAAWTGRLSDRQIEAVVDYVIVKFMEGKAAPDESVMTGHEHHGHDHSHVKRVDYPYGLKPDPARGKGLYATVCAKCHGARGDGQGPSADTQVKPRDFRSADFREFATGFSLFSAVSRGKGHMPAWEKVLGNQDIADISEYVLRTFVHPKPAAAPKKKS